MGDSGYAIVGTKVIVSDDLIVHDAGDDVYYNLEIITSLLTNAYLKELDKKIGNQITSLYISDSSLNESRYKVYSDSTLLNKTDVIQLKVKNNSGAEKSTKFFNMDSMCRGMNTASRVFKLKDSQGRDASVTVIVDLDFVVPSSTAFADGKLSTNLLNGPLTANNLSLIHILFQIIQSSEYSFILDYVLSMDDIKNKINSWILATAILSYLAQGVTIDNLIEFHGGNYA